MSNTKKTVKVECQVDASSGDHVTVHHMHNSSKYAVGRRPVMDPNGPSYTYQGNDWSCVGTGEIISVHIHTETLTATAIVRLDQ